MLNASTRPLKAAAAPPQRKRPPLPKLRHGFLPAALSRVRQRLLALPFDNLRIQYANAVLAGVSPRSLIASGRGERALDALEKMVLGPLARQR